MSYEKIFEKIKLKSGGKSMIVVDGVVGVGKSTLMRILGEKYNLTKFEEPVVDNPILEKFYYDRKRYSFALQIFFLNKRFEHIKAASNNDNAILDRSIYGDVIFAKMLMENDEMTKDEYEIYEELFHNMLEHVEQPRLMIYLENSVDEAVKKIKKRGRDYELQTEIEYWEKLNKNYKEYFDHYNFSPILRINVDGMDFENNKNDREKVLRLIEEALNN